MGTEEIEMQYVTIHHIDMRLDLHGELRYGERDCPTLSEFEEHYEPAETILGTSDLDEAYKRAQGPVVNRQQNARHMVSSSQPTDVYEVHDGDSVEFHIVQPFGFEQTGWGAELEQVGVVTADD